LAFPRPPSLQQWCPPTPDIFKVNFNAAIFQSSNLAGLDVIVCDSSGAAIGALSVPISLGCSVAELEALVCLRAVQFALEIALTRVVLKGDSAAVIDALWHGLGELTSYENVLDDIRVQVSVSSFFILGKNTILVPIFWGHSQFGLYILIAINLVPVIFNLQQI